MLIKGRTSQLLPGQHSASAWPCFRGSCCCLLCRATNCRQCLPNYSHESPGGGPLHSQESVSFHRSGDTFSRPPAPALPSISSTATARDVPRAASSVAPEVDRARPSSQPWVSMSSRCQRASRTRAVQHRNLKQDCQPPPAEPGSAC